MIKTQLQNKIKALGTWLRQNQKHPDYCLKHQELKKLKSQLNEQL